MMTLMTQLMMILDIIFLRMTATSKTVCFEDEEGDLPMYETESSSSCADDYEPFLDPDGDGSEPMLICALLEWYKAHIASGYSQLSVPM
jgi:hypothetical protein